MYFSQLTVNNSGLFLITQSYTRYVGTIYVKHTQWTDFFIFLLENYEIKNLSLLKILLVQI